MVLSFIEAKSVVNADDVELECYYPFTELFKYSNETVKFPCICNKNITKFELTMNYKPNENESTIELNSENCVLSVIPGTIPVEYNAFVTARIEETGESSVMHFHIHPNNVLDLEGVRYNYTAYNTNICHLAPHIFVNNWNGAAYVPKWHGYEDEGEFVEIFPGCHDSSMWMNLSWNMTIEEEGDYKFYLSVFDSAVLFIDDEMQIDLCEVCLTNRTEEMKLIYLNKGIHSMKVNTEGYYWRDTKPLTMLIYYSKPNSDEKLPLPVHCYDDTFAPLLELSSPSYKYHFVRDADVIIPLKIKQGYRLSCESDSTLPTGLDFNWDYTSIVGKTVYDQDEKVYHISCRNAHSVTNIINITISISGTIKPGLNAYYIKANNFSQNCLSIYYPDDKDSLIYVSRHENQISHTANPETRRLKDLSIDFNGEYTAVYKGYLRIEEKGGYNIKVNFSDTVEVSIGSSCYFAVGHCRTSDIATNRCQFDKELYPFAIGYTNNYNLPYLNFTMTLNDKEIIPQFYYETIGEMEYNYTTVMYQVGNEIIPNKLLIDDSIIIKGLAIDKGLPQGLTITTVKGEISGIPTKESEMTEYKITIKTTDKEYTTTIKMGVEMVDEPSGFYYHDLINNIDVKPGSIYPTNEEIKMEVRYKNGSVSKYYMFEELPKTFHYKLEKDKLIIIGKANENIHVLDFYFKAYSGSVVTIQEFLLKFDHSKHHHSWYIYLIIGLSSVFVVGFAISVLILKYKNRCNGHSTKNEENVVSDTTNQPLL